MDEKNRVYIFDTTMRDGEQWPGASMSIEEKIQISRVFDELGVDIIEAGFPIASPGDFEAVTDSKSPGEAMGNPASIMSTPNSSKTLEIWIFSSRLMDAPGDCSPSRIVVSNSKTLFVSLITLNY